MTEISQELQEKLLIVDELSKAYQRISSVTKDVVSDKITEVNSTILDKIKDVVDDIKKV